MNDTRAPLFKLSADIFDAISMEDIDHTAQGMTELGIYHPPFKRFKIQFKSKFMFKMLNDLKMAHHFEFGVNGDFYIMFEYMIVGLNDANLSKALVAQYISSDGVNFSEYYEGRRDLDPVYQTFAIIIVKVLIVMLATKNVVKKVETCNKPNSRKRREKSLSKYSSVTTISIGKITETKRSSGGGGGSIRPHLRRGHIRNQLIGKGRSDVKRIFIQPMFVSADQGWIDEQKEYRVKA